MGIPNISSQGVLYSEATKPYAEAAGHGRKGWCVWVQKSKVGVVPTTPRSLERARREMSDHLVVCADQALLERTWP